MATPADAALGLALRLEAEVLRKANQMRQELMQRSELYARWVQSGDPALGEEIDRSGILGTPMAYRMIDLRGQAKAYRHMAEALCGTHQMGPQRQEGNQLVKRCARCGRTEAVSTTI